MPKVAVSPSDQPNAFATGRNPKHAVVCATQGLLDDAPRRDRGVMAHEMMHVKHRDILIGSVAAAIATAISFVAQMAMLGRHVRRRRNDDARRNPLGMLAVAMLAPIAASLIQMAVSRSREFEADRGAAELLGTGDGLADALRRIETPRRPPPDGGQPGAGLGLHPQPAGRGPQAEGGEDRQAVLDPPGHRRAHPPPAGDDRPQPTDGPSLCSGDRTCTRSVRSTKPPDSRTRGAARAHVERPSASERSLRRRSGGWRSSRSSERSASARASARGHGAR